MRPIFAFLIIFFGGLIICSCQKEFLDPEAGSATTPPTDTTVTPPHHDSVTLLSRLILMKAQTGSDTAGVYEYLFDDHHRVTSINYYNYQSGTPVKAATITYFYQGTDSLSYKSTYDEITSSYNETSYYFYDNDLLAKDSIIFPDGMLVDNFFYASNSITDTGRIYFNSDPLTAITYSATGTLNAAKNVFKTVTVGDNFDYTENTFSYDDKPNPFSQLNINSTFNPVPGYNFHLYNKYHLGNNVTVSTQEEIIAQGPKITTTYAYLYNPSGMPVSVLINSDYGTPDDVRILFEYKTI